MRLVRKNYDKANRCPGWSGSGFSEYPWETKQNATVDCTNGNSGYYDDSYRLNNWADWNFHMCDECGTLTLPRVLRYIDPEYWYSLHITRFVRKTKRNMKKFMKRK